MITSSINSGALLIAGRFKTNLEVFSRGAKYVVFSRFLTILVAKSWAVRRGVSVGDSRIYL